MTNYQIKYLKYKTKYIQSDLILNNNKSIQMPQITSIFDRKELNRIFIQINYPNLDNDSLRQISLLHDKYLIVPLSYIVSLKKKELSNDMLEYYIFKKQKSIKIELDLLNFILLLV